MEPVRNLLQRGQVGCRSSLDKAALMDGRQTASKSHTILHHDHAARWQGGPSPVTLSFETLLRMAGWLAGWCHVDLEPSCPTHTQGTFFLPSLICAGTLFPGGVRGH